MPASSSIFTVRICQRQAASDPVRREAARRLPPVPLLRHERPRGDQPRGLYRCSCCRPSPFGEAVREGARLVFRGTAPRRPSSRRATRVRRHSIRLPTQAEAILIQRNSYCRLWPPSSQRAAPATGGPVAYGGVPPALPDVDGPAGSGVRKDNPTRRVAFARRWVRGANRRSSRFGLPSCPPTVPPTRPTPDTTVCNRWRSAADAPILSSCPMLTS